MSTWIIVGIFIAWFIYKSNQNKVSQNTPVRSPSDSLSEELVFEEQTKFEERLNKTHLPDAASGKEIYIYRQLIVPWFSKLSSENRYNETTIQKLRQDLLNYMYSLERRNTQNFLSLESDDKESQKAHREEHINESRKVFAIEEAFAAMIGKDAVEKLKNVREANYSDFNKYGERAPMGFKYDLDGELREIKKDK